MTEATIITNSRKQSPRSFRPLILFHEDPSEVLLSEIHANRQGDRMAIEYHWHKTNATLEQNSYYFKRSNLGNSEIEENIEVLPSNSTASNISSSLASSSSSYEDSIKTGFGAYSPAQIPQIEFRPSNGHSSPRPCLAYDPIPSATITNEIDRVNPPTTKNHMIHRSTRVNAQTHYTATSTTSTTSTKKRRRGNLPKEVTEFLRDWLLQHKRHPYPAEKEKADLARRTGLTVSQISNWFINARRRILQPMLESEHLTAQLSSPYSYAAELRVSSGIVDHGHAGLHPFATGRNSYHETYINNPRHSLHTMHSSKEQLPSSQGHIWHSTN